MKDLFTEQHLDVLRNKCNSITFKVFREWYGTSDTAYLIEKWNSFVNNPINWLGYADKTRYQKLAEYLNS